MSISLNNSFELASVGVRKRKQFLNSQSQSLENSNNNHSNLSFDDDDSKPTNNSVNESGFYSIPEDIDFDHFRELLRKQSTLNFGYLLIDNSTVKNFIYVKY
jgi:hypothetical protein